MYYTYIVERKKGNKVYCLLEDEYGEQKEIEKNALKAKLQNKKIQVINVQLRGTKLFHVKPEDKYDDLDKALLYMTKAQMNMGDSYREIVEGLCFAVNRATPAWESDDSILDIYALDCYSQLKDTDYIVDLYKYSIEDGSYNIIIDEAVSDAEVIKSMRLIYKQIRKLDKKFAAQMKELIMDKLESKNLLSANIGEYLGNHYYKYLDSKLWGTISNDFGTVGHRVSEDESARFKLLGQYTYVHHIRFNRVSPKPQIGVACAYRNEGDKTLVDFYMYRIGEIGPHSIGTRGYIKQLEQPLQVFKTEESAKKVGNCVNYLGHQLDKIALQNPHFYSLLPLNAPLEQM